MAYPLPDDILALLGNIPGYVPPLYTAECARYITQHSQPLQLPSGPVALKRLEHTLLLDELITPVLAHLMPVQRFHLLGDIHALNLRPHTKLWTFVASLLTFNTYLADAYNKRHAAMLSYLQRALTLAQHVQLLTDPTLSGAGNLQTIRVCLKHVKEINVLLPRLYQFNQHAATLYAALTRHSAALTLTELFYLVLQDGRDLLLFLKTLSYIVFPQRPNSLLAAAIKDFKHQTRLLSSKAAMVKECQHLH